MSKTSPFIKTGKEGMELTPADIFDRIINLKFTRQSGRSFTIRSDYEPVFHKDNSISFKKCSQKPDIKVSYMQVSADTDIAIDIEIKNIYIEGIDAVGQNWGNYKEETDASSVISTSGGDPVIMCEIQMGYRAQFPDWTDSAYKNNIDQFYELNNNTVVTSGSGGEVRMPQTIMVQILAGYPTSYPPDRTMYFKGVVAGFSTGLRWAHKAEELVKGFGDTSFPSDLSEIEECLFQHVTRRFVRTGVKHRQRTTEETTDVNGEKETKTTQSVDIMVDGKWEPLTLEDDGLMTVADANKYGVTCYCSKKLHSLKGNARQGYGLTEKQAKLFPPVPDTPFDDMQQNVSAQLNAIQQHYHFLRWYLLNDGSYFVYHLNETDKEIWNDPFVAERRKKEQVHLPAVYDITPVGVRTITCPFVTWVNPTTTVVFKSRFNKGSFVGYFYPIRTKSFMVITSKIKFATVEDVNEMSMMCVDEKDTPDDKEPEDKKSSEEKPAEEAPKKEPPAVQWTARPLTVALYRNERKGETLGSWNAIVKQEIMPTFRPEYWPEDKKQFSEKAALDALKEWNPDYFDPDKEYMKRSDAVHGKSVENSLAGIGGRNGVELAWLKVGDKIIVRYPFLPEYPDDGEIITE